MGVEIAKRIVLVGPDCSGKSVLAEMLSNRYGAKVIPNRRIKDDLDAVDSVLDFTRDIIRDTNLPFILDQWQYPVDIVYNKSLRGKSSPMEHLEPIISPYLQDVIFIHVDACDEVLRQRYEKRGDELWTADEIVTVANAYRLYFETSVVQVHKLDTSDLTPTQVLKRAIIMIEKFYSERGNQ